MSKELESFHNYLISDVFADISDRVTSRKMFGGISYYLDGRIFGLLVSTGELYYKVGDNNKSDFVAAGSHPFVYSGQKSKAPVEMPYWSVPEDVLEDPQKAIEWAEKSAQNSLPKN